MTQTVTNVATKVDNLLDNVLSNFTQTRSQWSQGVVGDSQKSLYSHFKDHGTGVNANSVDEYYNKANDFIENNPDLGVQEVRANGAIDTVYHNTDTGDKAIVSSDGTIRSYYNTNAKD